MMAGVSLPETAYADPARVEAFYSGLMTRLRSVPGIRAVSAASGVPLWSDAGVWDFEVEGRPRPLPGQMAWNAAATVARDGFFETLGIPLARGRFFTEHDNERSMPVAVINEAMARRFFAGEDPIGKRIRVKGVTDPKGWMTIVGVARDIRDESLDTPPRPRYYLAQSQTVRTIEGGYPSMSILMRVDGWLWPPRGPRWPRAVHDLDSGLPLFDVQTVDTIIDLSVARPQVHDVAPRVVRDDRRLLGATGDLRRAGLHRHAQHSGNWHPPRAGRANARSAEAHRCRRHAARPGRPRPRHRRVLLEHAPADDGTVRHLADGSIHISARR